MDEKTKVKINQISEMISIYQSGIGELNEEEKNLMIADLNDKNRQLEQFKNDMSKELDKLYAEGSNEIDESVNQLQTQIQKIEDLQETIFGFLFDLNGTLENIQNSEDKNSPEEKVDNIVEKSDSILEEKKVIEIVHEEKKEKKEAEIEFENKIEDEVEKNPIVENLEKDNEEKMIVEEKENNNSTISVKPNIEIKKDNFSNLSKKIQIKSITLSGKEIKNAEKIVESRQSTIESPINAVRRGNDAARLVMVSINKSFGLYKNEISEELNSRLFYDKNEIVK